MKNKVCRYCGEEYAIGDGLRHYCPQRRAHRAKQVRDSRGHRDLGTEIRYSYNQRLTDGFRMLRDDFED